MKAVIYARYSSDNQREESIEGQIRECTAFAEKNGMTVLHHYIDRAYSAKTDNRPQFQEMIRDSSKKLFDVIIVWKLDRFARNRYDSAQYKNILRKNGVKVVSANETISEGSEGILMESILEGFAEYFSADLAEKVSRGLTENALKCKFNGGNPTIGYQIDENQFFQINPLTAPFVLEIFKMYDDGATMSELRDYLNDHNVRNTRGGEQTINSVAKILKNRRYIGEYSYRDVVIPDGIPAIVPEDLFERVQEKIEKNKKAPARHKAEDDYLLTTKLFCGHCGAYMCGESGRSHTGKVHHYYKCVSVKKKRTNCKKKAVKKDWIEDLVVSQAQKLINDDLVLKDIAAVLLEIQEQENTSLPLYTQQLQEVERSIENLLNAIQQGIFTKSTKSRLEELEAKREELEFQIASEQLVKPKLTEENIMFWLHKFRGMDMRQKSHRQKLIDLFINRVYLYDDKLVITFNHKEGAETITLEDVETALSDADKGSDLVSFAVPKDGVFLVNAPSFVFLYGIMIAGKKRSRYNTLFDKYAFICYVFLQEYPPRLFLGHSEFIQGKGQVKKMRKLFLLLPAIALILSLSAYGRENVWLSVASASPAAHPVRMASTTAPEHDWVGATCTTAAVCRICGETRGRTLGHEWEPAACVEPKTCRICGATQGSALTHDWVLTDSSSPKTCRRCGMTEGSEPEVYTYLCDMTPIQRFGKLWIRSEEPLGVYAHTPADHPGCWDDLNTPGHSLGPVRDYEGNSYRYSMHLDSNTTAACYVTYRLDGQYNTFSGVCAYPGDAISRATVHATKYFRVYADDKLIFTSAQMNINTPPAPFSIDVTGVRVLRIEYPSSENPNEAATLYDARLS